jgi:predicted small secreted protein
MKLHLIAGLALASLSLAGCGTLQLTGNPAADAKATAANLNAATNPQQFMANVKAFNDTVGQACGGYGNLDWTPPLPPTGSLHVQCAIGKQPAAPGTLGLSSAAVGTDVKP